MVRSQGSRFKINVTRPMVKAQDPSAGVPESRQQGREKERGGAAERERERERAVVCARDKPTQMSSKGRPRLAGPNPRWAPPAPCRQLRPPQPACGSRDGQVGPAPMPPLVVGLASKGAWVWRIARPGRVRGGCAAGSCGSQDSPRGKPKPARLWRQCLAPWRDHRGAVG